MLVPPDLKRCQAEKSNGANFMTLGGRHEMVRCEKTPTVVAFENEPGKDGQRGSMSLCDDCSTEMVRQFGDNFCTFAAIVRKEKK